MKNYIQNGDYIDVAAPTGGVKSGEVVIIGKLIGVAVTDAAVSAPVSIAMTGVFDLPKAGATVFAVGDYVYFDEDKCVTDDTKPLIGVAVNAPATNAVLVKVRLQVGATGPEGPEGST